jgi:NAD(P)-dependent dehydrogenase (short-subunit alcohol dehydrogenase family)
VTKASAVEEAIGKVVGGLGLIDGIPSHNSCGKIRVKFNYINMMFLGAANLAGVMGQPTPLTSMADSEWDFLIDVNLNGAKNCTRAELQRANPDGCSIVNASSVVGQRPTPNNAAYCAAKAGVIAFSKSAALEAGAVGSRVNVVVP